MRARPYNEIARQKLSEGQLQANRKWAKQQVSEMNLRELQQAPGRTQVEGASAAEQSHQESIPLGEER